MKSLAAAAHAGLQRKLPRKPRRKRGEIMCATCGCRKKKAAKKKKKR